MGEERECGGDDKNGDNVAKWRGQRKLIHTYLSLAFVGC
jgi:hypothetical protein